jgi:L-fucose isomerase-like protein
MGFMDLRDEGIPAGCEADLDATLTMMLIQQLFDRPAFQHNPSVDTEKNLYFGAHCTCASRMNGCDCEAAPYVLRSHAEAGWGCVPEVLFEPGQSITIAKYLADGQQPRMILYSGQIVQSPHDKRIGGCRTKMLTTIKELDDICQLQGHHLCMWYGDCRDRMLAFNQMFRIETVV